MITLETGAVLQRSSEALDGIPYVHTGSAALHLTWCVSLQIDHGPEHFVFPSTLSPQDVARGYPRCRVIFACPFLRGRLSLTALDGKLTRCRPLAGSTVESFGRTAVSLSSNVLASCSSPASLSIRPVGTTLVRRSNPRIMTKSMAKCLSIPVGARGFVTESNTRLQSTIRMAEETLDVCVSVCRTKKKKQRSSGGAHSRCTKPAPNTTASPGRG